MNKLCQIFAVNLIATTLASAGTPSGASAFFLQSDFGYATWIHNDHDTIQSLQSSFITATKSDAGIFLLGINSARSFAQTIAQSSIPDSLNRAVHLRIGTPELFAGWSTPFTNSALTETICMSDANHYGAGLASQWNRADWTWNLQSNLETRLNARWNWQDHLFAGLAKEVEGDWSSSAMKIRSEAIWHHQSNTVSIAFEVVKTTPSPSVAHWGLRDSSFWVQGEASYARDWRDWHFTASATSLSGTLQLQGLRYNLGDEKLFMLLNTGWDVNTIWLDAAPRTSQDATSTALPLPTPITPWQKLLAKVFQQNNSQASFGLGYTWAHADLFPPNSDASEKSFWANRLFDANMTNWLGYSVFKKELAISGAGNLRAYHLQLSAPWWSSHVGVWGSVQATHWQATMHEQGNITVKSLVGEMHTPLWGTLQLDGILAQVSAGVRLRTSIVSPWIVYFEAQQLVPYLYHLETHNQDDITPIVIPPVPPDTSVTPTPSAKAPAWHYRGEGLSLHIGIEHFGW